MPPKRGGFRGGHGGTFRKGPATKKRSSPSDDESAPRTSKKSKSEDSDSDGITVVPEVKTDDDGNAYISLNASGKRRVTISEFNKNTLVSIREYWVNDGGELRPGKKGIALTVDQYNTLLAAAPLIERALAQKDIQVVRPDYEGELSAAPQTKGDEEGGGEEEASGEADEVDE